MGHTSTVCNGRCVAHGGRLPYQLFEPNDFVFWFGDQADAGELALFPDWRQRDELLASLGPCEYLYVGPPAPRDEPGPGTASPQSSS